MVGRKPLGKRAMTPAERQARRRARLRRELEGAAKVGKRAAARDRAHAAYISAPPGITYWAAVEVARDGTTREIMAPNTRPLAACENDLTDDDVLALLAQLQKIASNRGLMP